VPRMRATSAVQDLLLEGSVPWPCVARASNAESGSKVDCHTWRIVKIPGEARHWPIGIPLAFEFSDTVTKEKCLQ